MPEARESVCHRFIARLLDAFGGLTEQRRSTQRRLPGAAAKLQSLKVSASSGNGVGLVGFERDERDAAESSRSGRFVGQERERLAHAQC